MCSHDDLVFEHNDSINILESQQETIVESQQMEDKNNEENVDCNEQSETTVCLVPRRKRTKRKRMEKISS
jgi:hypothetical protein